MFIFIIHINGWLSENSLNIHHIGLGQPEFHFSGLLSQLNLYHINKHTVFTKTILMNKINFLCEGCYRPVLGK